MGILNPDPRIKPPLGCEIDWSHPLAQGLVGCWLFNDGSGNLVSSAISPSNNAVFINNPSWREGGVYFDDSNSQRIEDTNLNRNIYSGNFSICISAKIRNIDSNTSAFCGSRSTDRMGWAFKAEQYDDTGRLGLTYRGLTDYVTFIDTSLFLGQTSFFALSINHALSSATIVANSTSESFATGHMIAPDLNGITIGAGHRLNGGVDYFDGIIQLCFIYSGVLSYDVTQQLRCEPYAFIIWPATRLYFDLGAGGGTTIPISDSGSGIETAPVITVTANPSDTGTGSETTLFDASFGVDEVGSGLDTISSITILLNIDEIGGLNSESVTVTEIMDLKTVNDSGIGNDNVSNINIILDQLEENGTATDIISALNVVLSILSDNGVSTDGISVTQSGVVIHLSDSGNHVDQVILQEILATLSDLGTDSESLSIVSNDDIIDTGNANDALGIASTFSQTDTGTGSGSISIANYFIVHDTGTGVDTVNAREKVYIALLNKFTVIIE